MRRCLLNLFVLVAVAAGCAKPRYEPIPASWLPQSVARPEVASGYADTSSPLASSQPEISIQLVGYEAQRHAHFRLANNSTDEISYVYNSAPSVNSVVYRVREYKEGRWQEAGPIWDFGSPDPRQLPAGEKLDFTIELPDSDSSQFQVGINYLQRPREANPSTVWTAPFVLPVHG